jgi:hypothetical protein
VVAPTKLINDFFNAKGAKGTQRTQKGSTMVVVNRRLGCNDSGNQTLAIALIIFQLQLVNTARRESRLIRILSMTERLDRIEAIIEANAAQIQNNSAAITELQTATQTNSAAITELRSTVNSLAQTNSAAIAELRSTVNSLAQTNLAAIAELRNTVNSLVQIVEIHQRNHEVSQRNFEASQRTFETIMNEIRGLRTESQRILEHLFGKEEN